MHETDPLPAQKGLASEDGTAKVDILAEPSGAPNSDLVLAFPLVEVDLYACSAKRRNVAIVLIEQHHGFEPGSVNPQHEIDQSAVGATDGAVGVALHME